MPFTDEQVIKLIENSTRTAAVVETMQERLFGDGSDGAGAIAKLYAISERHNTDAIQALKDHAAEDAKNFKEVNVGVSRVKDKLTWYAGSIATAGGIGTLLLGLLTMHYAAVAAHAAEVANQIAIHTH